MSIELNWETLTTGPDGIALAEKIRDFVHDKFQTVTLPRFIKSVKVHEFEFGSIAPEIEIKDICDPLPDFYEETEDDYGEDREEEEAYEDWKSKNTDHETLRERRRLDRVERTNGSSQGTHPPAYIDTRMPSMRSTQFPGDVGSPFLGVSTPGIPGGTSNLHYFHSQLATGLSGTQTPLAAVAGAHYPNGWPDYTNLPSSNVLGHRHTPSGSSLSPPPTADAAARALREKASVSTLATSNSTTRPQTSEGFVDPPIEEELTSPPRRFREPRVEDLQTVFRVRYAGDVKLSLTAEILLDYPMPSFVGIPVKLNITGLSFDGVAVLAYIRKRAHFCFLSPEDAYAAIGAEDEAEHHSGMKMGGLLHEIKVESEIGQRENGKQVLKNVGKVEKFVLEQVRRIFEDEFVYPSFWTFLV
ncbi:probable Mitochondrial distribution and morphology protein 12 [Phialocephala subalpina]|uniref:Mitochondrial distribution and morphology protein 12 n=1 Tax=Phialocephala subalpina TaxID=576137 RepID=A0A1L7WQU1_9HELO|nr:probable Mitochondrial distribution and morphology protein 12 [Phialocephala subalpina]